MFNQGCQQEGKTLKIFLGFRNTLLKILSCSGSLRFRPKRSNPLLLDVESVELSGTSEVKTVITTLVSIDDAHV